MKIIIDVPIGTKIHFDFLDGQTMEFTVVSDSVGTANDKLDIDSLKSSSMSPTPDKTKPFKKKNPYKSGTPKYQKWGKLRKKLGRLPTKKEMAQDWRGKSLSKKKVEKLPNPPQKTEERKADKPMTDAERWSAYIKTYGIRPVCAACDEEITNAKQCVHHVGDFYHEGCFKNQG